MGVGPFLGEGCVFFVEGGELELKTQSVGGEELVGSALEIEEIQETLTDGHKVLDFLEGS